MVESLSKEEIIAICYDIITNAERFRNSYFWCGDNGNSDRRAKKEKYYSRLYEFEYADHCYKFRQVVTYSRNNVYFRSSYEIDGNVKDLRLVKKLLRNLKTEAA